MVFLSLKSLFFKNLNNHWKKNQFHLYQLVIFVKHVFLHVILIFRKAILENSYRKIKKIPKKNQRDLVIFINKD